MADETVTQTYNLALMTDEDIQAKIDWLEDYSGRTFWGHSQIRANIVAFQAELNRRKGS